MTSQLSHAVDWEFYRESDEQTVEVTIRYDIEPYVPGRISGPPEDCYPPEGGGVTDLIAFKPGTEEVIELTDEVRKEVSDWIERNHDHHADRYGDPDRAYDERRDEEMMRQHDSIDWDD